MVRQIALTRVDSETSELGRRFSLLSFTVISLALGLYWVLIGTLGFAIASFVAAALFVTLYLRRR